MAQDLAEAYAHCDRFVRAERRAAWLAGLLAPAAARPQLNALRAFFIEISRVHSRVSQPLAGELRLQWWADAIEGIGRGEVAANPVAAALLDTIARADLPPGDLIGAIEAYRTDLYDEPLATTADLETFCDNTEGGLVRLAIRVLTGRDTDDAGPSRAAGVAIGIAGLFCRPAEEDIRTILIPNEILERHGLTPGHAAAGAGAPEAMAAVAAEIRAIARARLAALRAVRIPDDAAPAFLPVNLVEPILRRSERVEPFGETPALPQWRQQWLLWRAARAGGVL